MQSLVTKLFFVIAVFVFLCSARQTYAAAPDVVGQVVTQGTNAPVAGVWVKWTDSAGDFRYAQTDAGGNYSFPDWADYSQAQWTAQLTGMIDSDLNGTNDTTQAFLTPFIIASAGGGFWNGFSCGQNPQTFTVIRPAGWGGSFSSFSFVINNGAGVLTMADLVYTPPVPTATPTPTPTPTPATFTISGNVYLDGNKNGVKDGAEANYNGAISITSSRGTVSTTAGGTYTISGITPGALTVSYNSLPTGYTMTYPLNGPPPSFGLTVGAACNTNGANGATCGGGNITNLSFGISNFRPWFQSVCGGMRIDNGITDQIPQTAQGGDYASTTLNVFCTNADVIFTGDSTATFGQGQASIANWLVGGTTYPEVYTPGPSGIHTSYAYLLAKTQQGNITPTNLSTICSLSNCTLPANLGHGVYQANGNVTLNGYTFPINQNYVILVNGTLTLNGNIFVPVGSTAVFSSSGNIIVTPTVGYNPGFLFPNLDGIYSTDRSFIVNSTNTCNDLTLSISGAVITNAALNGGSFQNQRDLCGNDALYPTIYFYQRPDFFLNLPDFLRTQTTATWEAAP